MRRGEWMRVLVVVSAFLLCIGPLAALAGADETRPQTRTTIMITLYASAGSPNGWGFGTNNITNPGPTLRVNQGDLVMFHLFSNDGAMHVMVIDLQGTGTLGAGNPASEPFNASASFYFSADAAGTFAYLCGMHGPALLGGSIVVRPPAPASDNTLLIFGGAILVVAIIGFAWYRSTRIPELPKNRRKKQPSRNGRGSHGKPSSRPRHRSGH